MATTKQPPYWFQVDDVPVKVDWDPKTKELYAVNDLGNAWAPIKAMREGWEITEMKFEQLKAERAKTLGIEQ